MRTSRSGHSFAGQALIEVLVAVSILTIGMLGVVTLLNRALSLNRVISDNYTATYLAAEGVELAKNLIDARAARGGWGNALPAPAGAYELDYEDTDFVVDQGRTLSFDPTSRLYGYRGSSPTSFRRVVETEYVDSDEIRVTSVVAWETRGGGAFSVDLEDHFYNWRP